MKNLGPYRFQRLRHRLGEYPRASQPNISQPNQKPALQGWGMDTRSYWNEVFSEYLRRKKTASHLTNLSLGRLR